jgi:PhoD-like phosphatase, N-terminal domain/PhoD-like phosphatase
VILWTRRPPSKNSEAKNLTVEVADDPAFRRVVATANAKLSSDADWTTRVFAAGLKPRRVYWYRFTDEHGFGSRVGRTITAPAENDNRPVSFSFVSCQNLQMGGSNAYRRMIWEDERKPPADQLGFVLHLGDFVYEVVWYPEDRPKGYYAGGHGYSVVHAAGDDLEVEFVCIVRPLERSERPDGGPLAYRVVHRVKRWTHEAAPKIERTRVEGTLPLVV